MSVMRVSAKPLDSKVRRAARTRAARVRCPRAVSGTAAVGRGSGAERAMAGAGQAWGVRPGSGPGRPALRQRGELGRALLDEGLHALAEVVGPQRLAHQVVGRLRRRAQVEQV